MKSLNVQMIPRFIKPTLAKTFPAVVISFVVRTNLYSAMCESLLLLFATAAVALEQKGIYKQNKSNGMWQM